MFAAKLNDILEPLIEKAWFWRCFLHLLCKEIIPSFFGIFHKCDKIDVVYKHKPYHGNNLRECTMPLDASCENRYQQIGYQNNPCLYLYGVDAVPIEEMKREVLFKLFV